MFFRSESIPGDKSNGRQMFGDFLISVGFWGYFFVLEVQNDIAFDVM